MKNLIYKSELLKEECPGKAPFLRGPYPKMYLDKPWTIRQYSGFSTARETNLFYKKNLKAGQTGLSVAFDLPTHRGYDSDHPRVKGDVGASGVAIDSVEDMKLLFKGIDLESVSVSMTMNGAIIPIMAFFIVTAEENNVPLDKLEGTIQNDILKEYMVRNTYIYPPKDSMKITGDIIEFLSTKMPKFNSISISGYHMQEAGASPELELALTLANGLEYVNLGKSKNLKLDDFLPRFSFFWGIGMNFWKEIAKLRAARVVWNYLLKDLEINNPKSSMLRAHCQTSGWSLTAKDPLNNISRTGLEAMAAILGGTQSLHTNSLDEALALPTDYSAGIARDTQLFLRDNSGLANIIDPFGGCHILEENTIELINGTFRLIQEIQEIGGMTVAIEKGWAQRKIEDSALVKQAKLDSAEEKIIGVNFMDERLEDTNLDILSIDVDWNRKEQFKKLEALKRKRNQNEVSVALNNIKMAAKAGNRNLLELGVEAARVRATLGEISMALESVYGRYEAQNSITNSVYTANHNQNNECIDEVLIQSNKFYLNHGRRPRILIAKIGQDGHDRGAKVVASAFSDLGFTVDLGSLFQTPEEVAKQAIENDVDIVGISSLSGSHRALIPELVNLIKQDSLTPKLVVVGGIIPKNDRELLIEAGVSHFFNPGTKIPSAALEILESLEKLIIQSTES